MLAFSKLVLQIVINIFFRGGFFLFSDSVCCQSIYIFAKYIKLLIARFTAANWFAVSCVFLMDTKVEVHVVKMCKAVYRAWSTIQKTKLTYKKTFSD